MSEVKLSDKKKREYLIKIIKSYVDMSITLLEYFKATAPTRKAKLMCSKYIKKSYEGRVHLDTIKHIEILEYLYSIFVGNNAINYSITGTMLTNETLKHWDTESGFEDFKIELEEQRKKNELKAEAERKRQEALKKAKEEGKKVEFVYNKDTKSVEPLIVEEKPN